MGAMASQIISLAVVCWTVYSGADQRKHQSSASLTFVRGIHRWPVNSPHKWPVTRKIFHLMMSSWSKANPIREINTGMILYSSWVIRWSNIIKTYMAIHMHGKGSRKPSWVDELHIWLTMTFNLRAHNVRHFSIFSIPFRVNSLALGQSSDCPSASEETLNNMDKYIT